MPDAGRQPPAVTGPSRWPSVLRALGAAVLFGSSAPLSKRLGLDEAPLVGSALLYGGAGAALLGVLLAGRLAGARNTEASLRRSDLPALAASMLLGGLLAPFLMLHGLRHVAAGTASLLLNLEMVFTAIVAVIWFREPLGIRAVLAMALVLAGAAWLGTQGAGGGARHTTAWSGALMVAGACLAWGFDNNVTQTLSGRDPRAIVASKGLGAAACAALLAWITGAQSPPPMRCVGGLALGAASYGTSLVLFVRALRDLGTARTAALFATAPFVGAVASFVLLGERLAPVVLAAGGLMALGVVLFVRERHEHEHAHGAIEHAHAHVADAHHEGHPHTGDEGPEPHAHPHRHATVTHGHAHAPDLHHRHRHD